MGTTTRATVLDELRPSSKTKTLDIPEALNTFCPVGELDGKDIPKFRTQIDPEWYSLPNQISDVQKEAESKDTLFHFRHRTEGNSIKCTGEKSRMKQQ